MAGDFQNQVVVITGAGRGIGRGHALAFSAQGAKVVVNDLGVSSDGEKEKVSPANDVVAEIKAMGGEAAANESDVSSWQGARNLLDTALDKYGQINVLVNNAAIIRPLEFAKITEKQWNDHFRINVNGTFFPTRLLTEHWINEIETGKQSNRCIICTTSRLGLFGTPYHVTYGCTKAAIAQFIQAAAAELEPYGIRVNGISPRADTRMMREANIQLRDIAGDDGIAAIIRVLKKSPEKTGPNSIDHIANAVVWLASEKAAHITGKIFHVEQDTMKLLEGWRESEAQDIAINM
jgi:NAD(P)-dependent dehydrogenase (short-subunit alcohol dehydrogenase family)